MKHFYLKTLCIMLFALCSVTTFGFTVGDVEYSPVNDKEVWVVSNEKYVWILDQATGVDQDHPIYKGNYPDLGGEIQIPNTIIFNDRRYKVTGIANEAFHDCKGLTDVTIPSSVKSIGTSAFKNCSSLKSVTIFASIKSIGESTFEGCNALERVVIPEGVKVIGKSAFKGCSCLTSVEIPVSVMNIREFAFSGCCGLERVIIPEGVTYIGESAYNSCSGLKSITISEKVTHIGESAFYGCKSLESVIIPESVTYLGAAAFKGCSSLTSVKIPSRVYGIRESVFHGCSGLTNIQFHEGVIYIGESAFNGCTSLVSVTFPESVTYIGESAFNACTSLISVAIPESVTAINAGTFNGCSSMSSVILPSGLKELGDNAFSYCTSLRDVWVYGKTPIKANMNCFSYMAYENATLHVPSEAKEAYGRDEVWSLFEKTTTFHYDTPPVTTPDVDTYIAVSESPGNIFSGHDIFEALRYEALTVKGVINGQDIITINKFENVETLDMSEAIVIGGDYYYEKTLAENDVLGHFCFCNMKKLKKVILPRSLREFKGQDNGTRWDDDSPFASPEVLQEVVVNGGKIGECAFMNCTGLKRVTLGKDVKAITDDTFWGCDSIAEVWCYGLTPLKISEDVFCGYTYSAATLYVPVEALSTYEEDAVWSKFKNIKTFDPNDSTIVTPDVPVTPDVTPDVKPDVPEGDSYVEEVEQAGKLFSGHDSSEALYYKALTVKGNINGPDIMTINTFKNVETLDMTDANVVGDGFYYYVSSLENILATDNVLGHFCFRYLNKLKKVMLPESLREFKGQDNRGRWPQNDSPFASPATLEEVVVNGGKIGECAFMKCTRLKRVILGEGVTDITGGAFGDCSNITEVWNYGLTPLKLSVDVFCNDTYANATLYVPAEALSDYKADFVWSRFKNIKAIEATGIAAPTAGSVTVRRLAEGGLAVDGADGMSVTVYDAAGRVVSRWQTTVLGLSHGLYIVRVGKQTYEVAL